MNDERLINRDRERALLHTLANAGAPRLALLTGRRRIGKTFLLAHAWPDISTFAFTAARTSPEINRRQFIEDYARFTHQALDPADYPTWRTVFNLVFTEDDAAPHVIVIDEFSYLAEGTAGLSAVASELNAAWERRRSPRSLLVVLAGSAVSTMEALAGGGSPLYGRFHAQLRLNAFDYLDTAAMVPFPSLRNRIETYAAFGGIPRYLASLDPEAPWVDQAADLLLAPHGEVRNLVQTTLEMEEGIRDVATYRGIVRAVASGVTRRNEMAQRLGTRNDQALRDKIDVLIRLGYLEVRRNVDAKRNAPALYGVTDPALRFHHRFVEPNLALLERRPAREVWRAVVAPQWDAFVGPIFERIAQQGYERRCGIDDLPIVRTWSRFEGNDRSGAPIEIDLVAKLVDGGVLTGAVKWNRAPIRIDVHLNHLAMLERAAHAGRAWAHEALAPDAVMLYVAAGGFEDGFVARASEEGRRVVAWTLEDLFDARLLEA